MKSYLYAPYEEGVETPLSAFSGTILEGGYEIQELLRSEPHASVFRARILGDRYTQAEVTFFNLNEREAAAQIECWRNAKALPSPHFNAPLSFGTSRLAEDTIPYVVLVKADETLAGVIRERPLDAEEASETMQCVARALVDLHTSGFIHGFVSPEHILSIGQDIKLSGYTVRPVGSNSEPYPYKPVYVAPESSGWNSTPAADVWCLGASLVEAINRKACANRYDEQLESLPSRFAYIAKRCLETNPSTRATASEALDMLEGRISVAVPNSAPLAVAAAAGVGAASLPMIESAPAPEKIRKVSAVSMPAPSTRERVEESPVAELQLDQFGSARRPIWLYAGGGLLLLLLVLWLAWQRPSGPVPTQPSPRTSVPQHSAPVPVNPEISGTSEVKTSSGATAAGPTSSEQIWRVIVYAYHRREEAEEMAKFINQRQSKLDAKVFLPLGRSVLYLVTVGSPMTREEAVRYQSRAIASGMPRDTYIQNYRSELIAQP